MNMEFITTESSKKRNAPYSPGVIYNGILYISGQLALDPATGKVAEGGVREHARQALANMDEVLRLAGVSKECVIQCRVYTPDVAYWDDMNVEYVNYFGSHRPARVVVPTGPLHFGSLVEIEALAAVLEDRKAAEEI